MYRMRCAGLACRALGRIVSEVAGARAIPGLAPASDFQVFQRSGAGVCVGASVRCARQSEMSRRFSFIEIFLSEK